MSAVPPRVYELRTYHVEPGRMDALLARFREHTLGFFARHGMMVIGFWLPADPVEATQRLVYLMAYPSREAAERSWAAFRVDPDWIAARNESELSGPIVKRIESAWLDPVAFSPLV